MYLTQFNPKKGCYNNMGLTRLKRKFKKRRLTIKNVKDKIYDIKPTKHYTL